MFRSSHFWFLVTFGDKVTKILRNLCLLFARQGRQDGKKQKKDHATKVIKIPKNIRHKIWDEQNIREQMTSELDIQEL